MAKIESYAPGSFCWAELATTDAAAAKHFYGEMFGWTAVDMPMPEGVYTLFQSDGQDAAAVYSAPPGRAGPLGSLFLRGLGRRVGGEDRAGGRESDRRTL